MHTLAPHIHGMIMTQGLREVVGNILAHIQDFQDRGLTQRYFLDSTKSTLVVAPWNVGIAETFF